MPLTITSHAGISPHVLRIVGSRWRRARSVFYGNARGRRELKGLWREVRVHLESREVPLTPQLKLPVNHYLQLNAKHSIGLLVVPCRHDLIVELNFLIGFQ